MANTVANPTKPKILKADVDFEVDTFRLYGLDNDYTINATHEFLSSIPSGAIIDFDTLANKTVSDDGVFSSDPAVLDGGAPSETITKFALVKWTGSSATSPLIGVIDTKSDNTGISIDTDDGPVLVSPNPTNGWLVAA